MRTARVGETHQRVKIGMTRLRIGITGGLHACAFGAHGIERGGGRATVARRALLVAAVREDGLRPGEVLPPDVA